MASYGDDAPIAACATTPGNSALTLIRCSGTGSLELVAGVFSAGKKLLQAAGNTIIHGWIVAPDTSGSAKLVDDVLLSVFRAPKSYTGEDSLDISCHGGSASGSAVMAALRSAGFRDALPGEFTFRSFMNGKIDLTRSESVMEIVSAKTDRGRYHAVHRLSGVLELEINDIKQKLVAVLAAAEIYLDYSEDEISADSDEIAGRLPNRELALESLARLHELAQSWQSQRIYQEGIFAVIAGRTNAGKSSLFNLLLKEERSIVTDVPGTTRDWIEAWISLNGIPIRLADTAGLRESADLVEKIGIERSRDLLEAAELVLYLIDGEAGLTDEDRTFIEKTRLHKRLLVLWNKADIAPLPETMTHDDFLCVSAKTGKGIVELTSAMTAAITGEQGADRESDAASIGTSRQKRLVDAAIAALQEAIHLADREEPLDIITPMLREAVHSLGEITGEVSTADILEEMFSKFCVGK